MDLQSYFNNSTTNQANSAFFDDLSTQSSSEIPTSPTAVDESDSVPNEVRDFWEAPVVEAGVPPILTTPGIMTPDDLVSLIFFSSGNSSNNSKLSDRQNKGRSIHPLRRTGSCFKKNPQSR